MLEIKQSIPNLFCKQLKDNYFQYRMMVSREPKMWFLYYPFVLRGQVKFKLSGSNYKERIVNSETELIIDGFQGSANSFATEIFTESQHKKIRLAHHMHSPSQIIQGINLNLPVLLLIREPVDTILSLTSRWSYISVNSGLKNYIAFYSKLEPYSDSYIVSTFEQTTQNLSHIISKVNHKFNTQFDIGELIPETAKKYRIPNASNRESSESRKQNKEQKRQEFMWFTNNQLLEQATNLYLRFEQLACK